MVKTTVEVDGMLLVDLFGLAAAFQEVASTGNIEPTRTMLEVVGVDAARIEEVLSGLQAPVFAFMKAQKEDTNE